MPPASQALQACSDLPIEAFLKFRAGSSKPSKTDSVANFAHDVKVKVNVVVGVKDGGEKFAGRIKMP